MTEEPSRPGGDTVKQRVLSLLAPLPLRFVYDVLRQVRRWSFVGPPDRLEAVKHTVVDYLNTHRPQRARRLFTDLFEPILISDPVLLRARRPIPGVVQRVDAGALWEVLNATSFSDIAATVQKALDALSFDALVDDVLKSPEAHALQDRMRVAAIRVIAGLLADDRALARFLEALNRNRQVAARHVALYLDTVTPVDRAFLLFVREYLESAEACRVYLHAQGSGLEPPLWSEVETERQAERLAQAVEGMRRTVVGPQCRSVLPVLVPLTALNVGQQYGIVALYVREAEPEGAGGGAVIEALIGHFAACCATVIDVLNNALKLNERLPGASIKVTQREMVELDGVLHRLALLIPALIVAGILENRETEPVFGLIWQELAHFLSDRLALVVGQRVTMVIASRRNPALDHRDVVWVLRLIWTWHQLARTYDHAFGVFDTWRDRILGEVMAAVERAARVEPGEAMADRVNHILRLNEIAQVFGERISPALSVSSPGAARMVAYCLEAHPEMTVEEQALVCDFLAMVRAEMARSRNWKSPELTDLLSLAEVRGL